MEETLGEGTGVGLPGSEDDEISTVLEIASMMLSYKALPAVSDSVGTFFVGVEEGGSPMFSAKGA